ncbi:IS256 family transposase [Cytobacillus spongiae]|uniref:IS256 family transposase n=1 Tax=Cytobacillus spongiae TaxID=2901381 RepID=UPI001F3EBD0F|nr:IS256 family transposase [Cytobacillus spongiae]UII54256.1 IS256 family transposase [Cytobacillus spongiae]UII55300.1 IS256 family transposase [Cytobacillus spongiae]UII56279.1 IS256 family transposase [Cytobacillus spongiae]UII56504.1 IS256 family transposase [Cytobacillus spongiae]UII56520.1 IS256 family transposase [Cytobacillus spongiae]
MQSFRDLTVRELASQCQTVDDIHMMMKELFRETLQQVFEAEIEEHLGYSKHDSSGNNTGNSRNGYSKKSIKTKLGETPLSIPRDRKGEYEPQIIKKYETSINGLEDQIIALYSKGMSTRDIEQHMKDIYGVNVSPSLVSKVTDKILPLVYEWQSRLLEPVYPIVFLDAIHFKVKHENRIVSKAAYTVLGINTDGIKDILGIWIGEDESASFWLNVCQDLKSRGVEDILIVCKDGLSGFSEAISATFPKTDIQSCIIHQLRNNVKGVPMKYRKELMADLKLVYKAVTLEKAESAFQDFKEQWGQKYPAIIKSWETNWLELTTYFSYPVEIRKLIYTTNTIEAFHRQLRKVTKTKTAYPTDNSLRKIVFLATMGVTDRWTVPVPGWMECRQQFEIMFAGRLGK